MKSYNQWLDEAVGDRVKMYELYLLGPGIGPVADKALKAIKGIVPSPKSFLVVKFKGTPADVRKVESALGEVQFRVVDTEIEHD